MRLIILNLITYIVLYSEFYTFVMIPELRSWHDHLIPMHTARYFKPMVWPRLVFFLSTFFKFLLIVSDHTLFHTSNFFPLFQMFHVYFVCSPSTSIVSYSAIYTLHSFSCFAIPYLIWRNELVFFLTNFHLTYEHSI